jgi:hypothetical protein
MRGKAHALESMNGRDSLRVIVERWNRTQSVRILARKMERLLLAIASGIRMTEEPVSVAVTQLPAFGANLRFVNQ